jgi:hypothetical protein
VRGSAAPWPHKAVAQCLPVLEEIRPAAYTERHGRRSGIAMTALARKRMIADDFIAWAMNRPDGEGWELVAGEPVAMAPERAAHARVKMAVVTAL